MSSLARLLGVLGCLGALACERADLREPSAGPPGAPTVQTGAPAVSVDGGSHTTGRMSAPPVERADLPALCKRPGDDAVRDLFCGSAAPAISGMNDLQQRLSMVFDPAELGPVDEPPMLWFFEGVSELALVLINSSTALSGRLVSTLNPRAIVIASDATMAFNRGVQQVELIARDRQDSILNMYLLRFEQACNGAPAGCTPGDLYTPRIEAGWMNLILEDDEDLKNTASDCRQCHQRARDQPIFLMRELDGPWTHFFMGDEELEVAGPELSGVDVVRAYHRGKGDEPYGNIPWAAIRATVGFTLQSVVERPQPLVFDGDMIGNERWPWTMEDGFATDPVRSETWYRGYDAFKRGEHLAMPHYDPFPSDPAKLAEMIEIYTAFREGKLAAEELPELSDVYPDDPGKLAEIGFQTEPGATPAQVLVQACASCHNDVLDQTISRARFNVDLARLDRAQLDAAVERISLPLSDPRHMPPREFRQLAPDAVAPLLEYLSAGVLGIDDDLLLRGAAEMGMAREVAP